MGNYDEISRMIREMTPTVMDIIISKLPKDNLSLWAIVIALLSVIISVLLPVISFFSNRLFSANNLRRLIKAYLLTFNEKIDNVLMNEKWDKKNNFEEYNRKNYEMMETLLFQVNLLNKKERDDYISFVINIKTSDELYLENNYQNINNLKKEVDKIRQVFK